MSLNDCRLPLLKDRRYHPSKFNSSTRSTANTSSFWDQAQNTPQNTSNQGQYHSHHGGFDSSAHATLASSGHAASFPPATSPVLGSGTSSPSNLSSWQSVMSRIPSTSSTFAQEYHSHRASQHPSGSSLPWSLSAGSTTLPSWSQHGENLPLSSPKSAPPPSSTSLSTSGSSSFPSAMSSLSMSPASFPSASPSLFLSGASYQDAFNNGYAGFNVGDFSECSQSTAPNSKSSPHASGIPSPDASGLSSPGMSSASVPSSTGAFSSTGLAFTSPSLSHVSLQSSKSSSSRSSHSSTFAPQSSSGHGHGRHLSSSSSLSNTSVTGRITPASLQSMNAPPTHSVAVNSDENEFKQKAYESASWDSHNGGSATDEENEDVDEVLETGSCIGEQRVIGHLMRTSSTTTIKPSYSRRRPSPIAPYPSHPPHRAHRDGAQQSSTFTSSHSHVLGRASPPQMRPLLSKSKRRVKLEPPDESTATVTSGDMFVMESFAPSSTSRRNHSGYLSGGSSSSVDGDTRSKSTMGQALLCALPMEVPLRATQATKEMRKMMGIFRSNPFTLQDVDGKSDAGADDGPEAGPLEEEPILIEFQIEPYNVDGESDGNGAGQMVEDVPRPFDGPQDIDVGMRVMDRLERFSPKSESSGLKPARRVEFNDMHNFDNRSGEREDDNNNSMRWATTLTRDDDPRNESLEQMDSYAYHQQPGQGYMFSSNTSSSTMISSHDRYRVQNENADIDEADIAPNDSAVSSSLSVHSSSLPSLKDLPLLSVSSSSSMSVSIPPVPAAYGVLGLRRDDSMDMLRKHPELEFEPMARMRRELSPPPMFSLRREIESAPPGIDPKNFSPPVDLRDGAPLAMRDTTFPGINMSAPPGVDLRDAAPPGFDMRRSALLDSAPSDMSVPARREPQMCAPRRESSQGSMFSLRREDSQPMYSMRRDTTEDCPPIEMPPRYRRPSLAIPSDLYQVREAGPSTSSLKSQEDAMAHAMIDSNVLMTGNAQPPSNRRPSPLLPIPASSSNPSNAEEQRRGFYNSSGYSISANPSAPGLDAGDSSTPSEMTRKYSDIGRDSFVTGEGGASGGLPSLPALMGRRWGQDVAPAQVRSVIATDGGGGFI